MSSLCPYTCKKIKSEEDIQNNENFVNMNSDTNPLCYMGPQVCSLPMMSSLCPYTCKKIKSEEDNENFVNMNSDTNLLCSAGPQVCSVPLMSSMCPYTCKTLKMSENRIENNKSCTKDTYTLGNGFELVEETCKDI
jgi:hypothetical protein